MGHVVLLGDSIFDNAAYVPGQPDVVRQLNAKLPSYWRATLCAVDGAVTRGVEGQLGAVPSDATHLVVSVGGNDALRQSSLLGHATRSVAEAVAKLAEVRDRFTTDYQDMLRCVMGYGLPVTLCTIYDTRHPSPGEQRLVTTGLTIFNDVITREAFGRGLPLIDLRLICNEPDDYANPIEPSAKGGEKIAAVIARAVLGSAILPRSQVFAE